MCTDYKEVTSGNFNYVDFEWNSIKEKGVIFIQLKKEVLLKM